MTAAASLRRAPAPGTDVATLTALFGAAADNVRAERVVGPDGALEAAEALAAGLRAGDHSGGDGAEAVAECARRSGVDADGLADAVAVAAGELGDRARDGALWRALITLAARVAPGGCWLLQPSPLFTDELVAALAEEAAGDCGGPVLSALAVDPAVAAAASAAAGCSLVSSGHAFYECDEAGQAQPPHLDSREYPYVLHVVVEHGMPGARSSELIVHYADADQRVGVGLGDGLLLVGRRTLHHWAPIETGGRRRIVSIGFTPTGRNACASDLAGAKPLERP